MDIPQTAIDAARAAAPDRNLGYPGGWGPVVTETEVRRILEAAAPHLSGTCALHGDLDQAVILAAVSDPGSITPREDRQHAHRPPESVSHWQMRAVVASLTRS